MQRGSDPPEDIYSITVTSENLELLQNLFNDPGIDCGCRPAVTREARGYQTSVFAPQSRIDEFRKRPGLDIEVHHNASEEGRRRQREAGTGDRFEQGRIVPRGFGRKA